MKRLATICTVLLLAATAAQAQHSSVPAFISSQTPTLGLMTPTAVYFGDARGDAAGDPTNFNYTLGTQTLQVTNLDVTGTCTGCGGGGGTPGGADTDVQFNDSGAFGGTADFTFNKGTKALALNGLLSKYDGLTTAGLGLPVVVGSVRAVAQTSAIGTTTAFTVGAADAEFEANFAVDCTTTSAAATVNVTIGWTDTGSQAQTATLGSALVCTTLGAASFGSLELNFNAQAASTITYATSIANTPTYDIRGTVRQLTIN